MIFSSPTTARRILANNSFQTVSGTLSSFDRHDFYQFTLNQATSFHASLNGLSADASLTLIDATGRSLQGSNRSGNLAESVSLNLNPGTYQLQVSSVSGNTLYDLQFSTNALFGNINDSVKFLAGDFNGDSFQDVIRQENGVLVNGIDDVQLFLGRADGNYGTGVTITNMATLTGNIANLIVGDFNGDGRDDLFRQELGIHVNGVDDAQILSFHGTSFQVACNMQEMNAFNGNFTNIIAGDFNQDGRTDLIRQEKGSWVNNARDVEIYLSSGGWAFSITAANHASLMPGNSVKLVASGQDLMRLESGSLVNGLNDVNFTSFVNGNFQNFSLTPSSGFSNTIVPKAWERPINQAYSSSLGKLISNQATLVSPFGTTGRYSTYESGATIHWSAKTGARVVTKEMAAIYTQQGGSGGWLGMVLNHQYSWNGGMRQDFEGGYLFRDANQAVALHPNQMPGLAPVSLSINGLQASYKVNTTIQLSPSYVSDRNGWNDIARVDFWLEDASQKRIELSDATLFSRTTDFVACFQPTISLNGIAAGNYTLRAIAQDKFGYTGARFSQAISITAINIAPQSLQIQGLQSSYEANSTLNLPTGYIGDENGWADIQSIDFWLTNAQNQRIELADVTSFTSHNASTARFSYSVSLANLVVGTYTLRATAYDKSGAASNSISQSFSILRARDWFDLNLKDGNVASLARNAATDRDLSRNEMLNIFRDIQDGGIIDAIEWGDLSTLVQNATGSLFSMKDHVRYLSSKVVADTVANMIASTFEQGVMGKWFLGTISPKAEFINESNNRFYTLQYQRVTGNLFGNSNQARISGIDQGYFLGDCVLLASIGATFGMQALESGRASQVVNQMLIDNGDQTYTVRFFNENRGLQAEWVTVDNRLAYVNGQILGAQITDGLFMPILEKAYAQWREWTVNNGQSGWTVIGNGDYIDDGIQRIVGRTAQLYWTPAFNYNSYSFELIQKALSEGKSITSGSATNSLYLVEGHAYSVTQAYISSTGQRRVVVYNPWGVDGGQMMQGTNDGFIDLSFDEFQAFQNIAIA